MAALSGNLFEGALGDPYQEIVTPLFETPHLKIERIVSMGQKSPEGFWHDQPFAEWVMILAGSAGLLFEGESDARVMAAGDYVLIPAHVKHRVVWTSKEPPAVWLAVHIRGEA
ncbi:MAG TPA: cupin domain-containing protein [Methylocella sp.]|nr:cupin domain-containing protein [Methylocella sp.]